MNPCTLLPFKQATAVSIKFMKRLINPHMDLSGIAYIARRSMAGATFRLSFTSDGSSLEITDWRQGG